MTKKDLQSKVASLEKRINNLKDDDKSGDDENLDLPSIDQISAIIAATRTLDNEKKNETKEEENDVSIKRKFEGAASAVQKIMKRHKS